MAEDWDDEARAEAAKEFISGEISGESTYKKTDGTKTTRLVDADRARAARKGPI